MSRADSRLACCSGVVDAPVFLAGCGLLCGVTHCFCAAVQVHTAFLLRAASANATGLAGAVTFFLPSSLVVVPSSLVVIVPISFYLASWAAILATSCAAVAIGVSLFMYL
jgi:hypothetical protein